MPEVLEKEQPMGEVTCPICGTIGVPAHGFVMDRGDGVMRYPAQWVKGLPTPAFWTGTKTKDRVRLKIEALRCEDCGYLMLFANRPATD
jgi:DNA-directed RNA polymerase subunit RPC12/RpoP